MPRTPVAQNLRNACSVAMEADERRVHIEQVIDERRERALSRREFMGRAAKAGLGTMVGMTALDRALVASSPTPVDIAIIGAGLAGLTCAHRLKQAGYAATIYEASNRISGRCLTRRNYFDDGQIAERGGELIDTGHRALRRLARELGLDLDDLIAGETAGTLPLYCFDGSPYTFAEASADFATIVKKLRQDVKDAGYPTLYNHFTPRGFALDHLSVIGYINETVPGGGRSKLGQLLDVAYNIEYGAECSDQSSLNLLYLLGYSAKNQFQIFGESDERFHIRGGNDQVSSLLATRLQGQIQLSMPLVAIRKNADGSMRLTFDNGSVVNAGKVVLALPFSILKSLVDFRGAGFSDLKVTAINEMGMGTNSKMQLQFDNKRWRNLGCNGETFADTGYQSTWEASRAQPGRSGILVDYTGGNIGASFNQGTLKQRAKLFLSQIEPVLPGLTSRWNGKAILDYWTGYQWTRGSYSYWKVGQYTKFAGIEGQQEGNCHFAGEHTSIDYQGYLNGAVDTGERAADEVISDLGGATFPLEPGREPALV